MGKVELKKVELKNGEVIGYREGGEGKTILLVHGNMVSSRHWGELLERLADEYHVVAVDLRGAGESSYNRPIETFKDFAEDIKLLCDELNLRDFLLIGWSMGGGISQRFAADYQGYANSLILYESIPCSGYSYHKKGPNGEFLPECYQNKEELLQDRIQLKPMIDALENNNRAFIKYLWDQLVFNVVKPSDEEYEKLLDDIFMTRNLRDAAWAAHSFNISHMYNGVTQGSGEVDNITIPVRIFAGDRDLIVPSNLAYFTAKEIGDNAEVVILNGCGHTPHYDNIELVLQKIKEFYR
ncbi:MAG: 3-oxoadipate enol-lactonase [Caloramator sp.]|uniref:Pimeloyl-ACP methyl ester carboxylesterase n=1 Tax=Caloramator proteoclasticus DSM 10124 TaxID=1121262 RepID=A0A1M4S7L5_9CLOT|nr:MULTISPECIES: alpha/beta hydrolase [Caloramator]GIW48663.1 MAG: 3-oxoadipate enol-lactonase [Caloramator sp.]SHE28180.1 Pimeloyl-ACP methyl ester carboxylesterase [Caloramator proteoclasticus DSM 10124]